MVASLALVMAISIAFTACQTAPSRLATLRDTVSQLNLNDPEADAESNFARGDARFIGVVDVGCHAPGREGLALKALVATHGLRCLAGTSDVVENSEHRALQEKVSRYGIAYNKRMAALIAARSNNSFKPSPLRGLGRSARIVPLP